ncbi:MAG: hypothetical protein Q7R60_03970 [bacterium]|nr:hypothetical protein [bacterium]
MARLPIPGSDDGTWGDILNYFLKVEHNTDGSQKTLPVSKGGTGATDAATALTNLGAASSTDLAAKATDSNVVHKTGTETITGNKDFTGTLTQNSQTVILGNDSRLTDQRTPSDSSVTDAKISSTLSPSKITGTAVITTDSRLSDSRTPLSIIDDSVVFTGNLHPVQASSGVAIGQNVCRATSLKVTKTGTISDIGLYIGNVVSGNVDVAILRFDGTNYNFVWTHGSMACPAANTWTSMGNPNVAVTAGETIWLAVGTDSSTTKVGLLNGNTGINVLPSGWYTGSYSWMATIWSGGLPATGQSIAAASVTGANGIHNMGIKIT